MGRNGSNKFILIFILLLVVLLVLIIMLIRELKVSTSTSSKNVTAAVDEDHIIDNVLEKNNCKFIDQEVGNKVYLEFPGDLYNSDGSSNEQYFEKLVKDIIPIFNSDFQLFDNKKGIKISVVYDYNLKDYTITYNDRENFYAKTNGKSYIDVDNVKFANGNMRIFAKDYYLERLTMGDMFLSSIKDKLGEGVERENKYFDYLDGTISIRTSPNDAVKNIIFKKGYKGSKITDKITMDTPLTEIYENFPDVDFGSLDKGYLGYRIREFYVYFYNDEISFQTYAYHNNTAFERVLSRYIENNNLNEFVKNLTSNWKNYDSFKYDEEAQTVYLLYSSRGVEINIKNNDSKGITLYSNYCFTDQTKSFVKNGYVSLNSEEDLINIIETKRRNNTLELY